MKQFTVGFDNKVDPVIIGNDELVIIAGPCAIENRKHASYMAKEIKEITSGLGLKLIYKSCYDKDCRSSHNSFHGVGIDEGLDILGDIREQYKCPVVSDFSEPELAVKAASGCDLLQVPAYLCRQTSILRAAASVNRPIHLKKGQFMSPWNMKNSVRKLERFGCQSILLTERGSFFGYNQLVNDMTSLPIMADTGYPVCYDSTHSIQMPTSMGSVSGGQREFIPALVRAAAGCGLNALFLEVHDNPDAALSDANTVLDIKFLEMVLNMAKQIHQVSLQLRHQYEGIHVT